MNPTRKPSLFWLPLAIGALAATSCAPFEEVEQTRCAAVYESGNGAELGINALGGGGDEIAQSFQPSFNKTITEIEIPLRRVGTLSGNIKFRLVDDNGGQPGTTNLATAADFVANSTTLSNSFQVVTFTLSAPVALVTGTTYWVRLQGDYAQSTTNHVAWRSNSAGGYASGTAATETNVANTFTISAHDALFRMGCEVVE